MYNIYTLHSIKYLILSIKYLSKEISNAAGCLERTFVHTLTFYVLALHLYFHVNLMNILQLIPQNCP